MMFTNCEAAFKAENDLKKNKTQTVMSYNQKPVKVQNGFTETFLFNYYICYTWLVQLII